MRNEDDRGVGPAKGKQAKPFAVETRLVRRKANDLFGWGDGCPKGWFEWHVCHRYAKRHDAEKAVVAGNKKDRLIEFRLQKLDEEKRR